MEEVETLLEPVTDFERAARQLSRELAEQEDPNSIFDDSRVELARFMLAEQREHYPATFALYQKRLSLFDKIEMLRGPVFIGPSCAGLVNRTFKEQTAIGKSNLLITVGACCPACADVIAENIVRQSLAALAHSDEFANLFRYDDSKQYIALQYLKDKMLPLVTFEIVDHLQKVLDDAACRTLNLELVDSEALQGKLTRETGINQDQQNWVEEVLIDQVSGFHAGFAQRLCDELGIIPGDLARFIEGSGTEFTIYIMNVIDDDIGQILNAIIHSVAFVGISDSQTRQIQRICQQHLLPRFRKIVDSECQIITSGTK